jgi:vacuolar-type H+-ATPase subunit D/Vma8
MHAHHTYVIETYEPHYNILSNMQVSCEKMWNYFEHLIHMCEVESKIIHMFDEVTT